MGIERINQTKWAYWNSTRRLRLRILEPSLLLTTLPSADGPIPTSTGQALEIWAQRHLLLASLTPFLDTQGTALKWRPTTIFRKLWLNNLETSSTKPLTSTRTHSHPLDSTPNWFPSTMKLVSHFLAVMELRLDTSPTLCTILTTTLLQQLEPVLFLPRLSPILLLQLEITLVGLRTRPDWLLPSWRDSLDLGRTLTSKRRVWMSWLVVTEPIDRTGMDLAGRPRRTPTLIKTVPLTD